MQSQNRFIIPQLFSFTNLSLGIISLLLQNAKIAALLIIIAALVDRMDGKTARKFRAESAFGKELDSLCDLVSFGAAPAVIAWKVGTSTNIGVWGYIPILIFVIAGAFRLARFNINNTSGAFMGLPITAGGVIVAFTIFFNPNAMFLSILLIILALLMVSKIKFKKI
jgi:CDP-diacylglycerol--serine O-phosphatidyltransferase